MTLPSTTSSHKLGPWTATSLVVGNIIGIGVFMLPASLAPYGWGSLLGWGVTLTGALCLAWVFAMLARHLPHAGGAMNIVRLAFGGGTAFLNGWGYWVATWIANAVIVIGSVSYLGRLIPALETSRVLSAATGVAILWLFAAINWRGLKTAGQVQLITSVLKMWPFLAAFTVAAMLLVGGGATALQPFDASAFNIGTAFTTTTLTLYTMLGIECAAIPGDAVANAERVVPRATLIGTTLCGVINALLCLALIAFMPAATVANSGAPLVDFVKVGLGRTAGLLVSVAVVIAGLGCLNGWVLLVGETPTVLAEAGELPAWWAVRNARGAARNAAIVSHTLTSVIILLNASPSLTDVFTFIVQLATATALLLYVLCPLAALRFMRDGRVPRSRGLQVAAFGALLFAAIAVIGSGLPAIAWGTALIAAGWPLYRIMKRRVPVAA
jgi:APA family basic amino acid/polyamine antiporter